MTGRGGGKVVRHKNTKGGQTGRDLLFLLFVSTVCDGHVHTCDDFARVSRAYACVFQGMVARALRAWSFC